MCSAGMQHSMIWHLPFKPWSNVFKHTIQLSGWLQPVQNSTAHFTFMFFASMFAPRLRSSSIMSGDLLHAATCRAVHPCSIQFALSETGLGTLVLESVSQKDWSRQKDWWRHLPMAGQCNSLGC